MISLSQWATDHDIPPQAYRALLELLGLPDGRAAGTNLYKSEAAVQQSLRVNAATAGARLWRNNVGAGYMQDGSFVRWGLANDSAAMNRVVKSSDLIGIHPVDITPDHVGQTIGQFVAIEVKKPGWRYAGTQRESAQLAFIEMINRLGGRAYFSTRGDAI